MPTSKPKLLVVTPYSPAIIHGHAADDVAEPSVVALSRYFDIHLYAPRRHGGLIETQGQHRLAERCTITEGADPSPKLWRFFGIYPAGARKDWSKKNSKEVSKLIRELQPAFIHFEYLQPAEAALATQLPWSITLHDVGSVVSKQRAEGARGLKWMYLTAERLRIARLEKRTLAQAHLVFTLSKRDEAAISSSARPSASLKLGSPNSSQTWRPTRNTEPVFVFAGAMWRDANALTAKMLIEAVMPLILVELPHATLRIVGTSPPEWLLRLHGANGIEVVGHVDELDSEYLRADGVFAPTLFDAGILLKALRALSMGTPLIVNSNAAEPIGLEDGISAHVKDSAAELAAAAVFVAQEPAQAAALAAQGKSFVELHFGWEQYATQWYETRMEHS